MATINAINSNIPIEVSLGGTGATSFTQYNLLSGNTTSAFTEITAGSDGQVLVGATGAASAFATLTSTDGTITFAVGANTLDLTVTSPGALPWTEVTGTSQAGAVNNGYICNNAALVTVTLPAAAAVGDVVRIAGKGAGGWKVGQNAGQTIYFGTATTTTGAGGSLASSNTRDAVELVCVTANNDWDVISSIGNITYV